MRTREQLQSLSAGLLASTIAGALAAVVVGAYLLIPFVTGAGKADETAIQAALIPPYDLSDWRGQPVQVGGRTKPFETFAMESLREITGRSKLKVGEDGKAYDATAVVLSWILQHGTSDKPDLTDWETFPFILCDHQDVREAIYAGRTDLEDDQKEGLKHGKFVAPQDVRKSKQFYDIYVQALEVMRKDSDKGQQLQTPVQRKVMEVARRLTLFDQISQNRPTTFGYLPATMPAQLAENDPVHLVALDKVPGGAWFSLGELRIIKEGAERPADSHALLKDSVTPPWQTALKDRMRWRPQFYISPEGQESLAAFQEQIKAKEGTKAIDALEVELRARREKQVAVFRDLLNKDKEELILFLRRQNLSSADLGRIGQAFSEAGKAENKDAVVPVFQQILQQHDADQLRDLKERVAAAQRTHYRPEDERWRMLHMSYLEAKYPDLYRNAYEWQPCPTADISAVLAAAKRVEDAYKANEASQFQAASAAFLNTVQNVNAKYEKEPPVSAELIRLEMAFNRSQPFMYAWIVMVLSMALVALALVLPVKVAKMAYYLGLAAYLGSLAYQVYGFYVRIAISGRAPVSNMYETVVWVAFMTAVFALVLELIYRKRVIALSGAAVATLGLVLADQLPNVLDPKISPLTPVLRSNYWLIIHVLTIVSSYAAGALAWGLGNVTLTYVAFGKPGKDSLKTLSMFTYRAIQIAVLLLAAGTFLGGWWAAESWGRFWGWDPKEVWALIALVCYVIPLHAKWIGWVRDFGLAVAAVVCFAAIMMSWYGVNFVLGAGLHSYGFGGGGPWWVFWAGLLNLEWLLICCLVHVKNQLAGGGPSQGGAAVVDAAAAGDDQPGDTAIAATPA